MRKPQDFRFTLTLNFISYVSLPAAGGPAARFMIRSRRRFLSFLLFLSLYLLLFPFISLIFSQTTPSPLLFISCLELNHQVISSLSLSLSHSLSFSLNFPQWDSFCFNYPDFPSLSDCKIVISLAICTALTPIESFFLSLSVSTSPSHSLDL